MASAAERLKELKKKLLEAREENLKAADYEQRQYEEDADGEFCRHSVQEPLKNKKTLSKENLKQGRRDSDLGSGDEAEGENTDERLRSMKRRARAMEKTLRENTSEVQSERTATITYGAISDTKEGVDRMVNELEGVSRRRAKYRRRRTFDEDRADISFINEGNRIFNRTLDRHFDKFESVQKIKDSLERGTAQ